VISNIARTTSSSARRRKVAPRGCKASCRHCCGRPATLDDLNGRSPSIDARFTPVEDLLAHLDGQRHRRFIKTHLPADCVPIFEECKYIAVYRDGRDTLMSWANHRGATRPEVIEFMNASGTPDGLRPLPPWDGDMDELFDQWSNDCSSITHLASWWPLRHEGFA